MCNRDDGGMLSKMRETAGIQGDVFGGGFCVTLFSLSRCFTECDDSGSGIVTSLLSWMDGSWLDSLYAFYTLASADGIGLAG